MNPKLVIDIGNTRTKLALFDGKTLVEVHFFEKLTLTQIRHYIKKYEVAYVMISTVRHLSDSIRKAIDEDERYFLLTTEIDLPFRIKYKSPQTLGLDRLAGVAGAWSCYPNQTSMVIDAGTCIKYDVITAEGNYLGGNIAPGVRMRLEAMHLLTSKLPQVEPYERYETMGTDTTSALQVGACTGAIHEAEGFIREYKKMFGKLNILLTGGDTHFFVNNLKTKIFAAPNLVLQGLSEILDYNVQKSC